MLSTSNRQLDCYELEYYAADAPGRSCLNGSWYPLHQGTFLCAKPGHIRRSILPFRCYYIHLKTRDPELKALLDSLPDVFMLPQGREAVQLWGQMLSLELKTQPEDRLLLESCVCRLIHLAYRQSQPAREGCSERLFLHQEKLLAVEQYIREHLQEELSLNQLAQLCNLSPTYFHSVFSEFFQRTPARYIQDCRIAAAKTGLLTGDYSLAELAADCGFSSQSYFCYKFKQVTGESPLQYRKRNLGKRKL